MPVFPSGEWVTQYRDELNRYEPWKEAAKTWEGDFVFEILPDGTGGLTEPAYFYIDLWHGECRAARAIGSKDEVKSEFVFSGPYANWVKLIKKEIDPIQGLMTRKFTLKGNMAKVMRAVKAAKELVNCTSRVPTTFA